MLDLQTASRIAKNKWIFIINNKQIYITEKISLNTLFYGLLNMGLVSLSNTKYYIKYNTFGKSSFWQNL